MNVVLSAVQDKERERERKLESEKADEQLTIRWTKIMDARRFRLRVFGHYIGRNALFYEVPLLLDRLSSLSLNGKSSLSLGPVTSIVELSSLKCSLVFLTMMDPFLRRSAMKEFPAIV